VDLLVGITVCRRQQANPQASNAAAYSHSISVSLCFAGKPARHPRWRFTRTVPACSENPRARCSV